MKRRLESRQVNGPHSSSKGKIDETVKRRVHNSSSKQIRSYIALIGVLLRNANYFLTPCLPSCSLRKAFRNWFFGLVHIYV